MSPVGGESGVMPDVPCTRVIIMGAAGRDFHNFNVAYRDDPAFEVVAFTAAQITGIENRRYPPALAGVVEGFLDRTGLARREK